ncbi:methylenetetrahydrofolate reductase [NAD(P)H] [Schlesneria paludicola]|uniref:methylenetetrahydrofolate reductase [NAD(P)H] n=1 Tax=Schlesneria paludicola TaxID=360056 RepID=UPI0002F43B3C|nr:methylenetetrahydrofolate reductase [NAD(P)H] [Schlesneria paludicola]
MSTNATRIRDLYSSGRFGLSIEIFPPKTAEGDELLRQTLRDLVPYRPSFVSCTYGAGGSTSKRTVEWCREIQEQHSLTATAHFTCVGSTREQLLEWLQFAWDEGLRNIMALRGDAPAGQAKFEAVQGGLQYANELVSLIREHFPEMGIGVAGYPEKHPEAKNLEVDFENLVRKVRAGADAIFTQLFFDNSSFYRFRDRLTELGIEIPVIPGIMPITEFDRIQRITAMCGAAIPPGLASRLESVKSDKRAQYEIGVDFAIKQCRELMSHGVSGIHFYVLNKSQAGREILNGLDLATA